MKKYSHAHWYPRMADEEHFNELRKDYPDHSHKTDEELNNHFNRGRKYTVTWDHVGEAYGDYEKLADAFFELQTELKERTPISGGDQKYSNDRHSLAVEIKETLEAHGHWVPENFVGPDLIMAIGKALEKDT